MYLWFFRDGGVLYLWFFYGRWCILHMVFLRNCGSRGGRLDYAAVLSVWGHGQHGVTDGVHRRTYVITIIYN